MALKKMTTVSGKSTSTSAPSGAGLRGILEESKVAAVIGGKSKP